MSMLHLSAEPFRVIFEALDAPTVQEPVSMAASMFEALDAATVQEVDFTAASILAALDASIENLSAVSVTSLVIRAALDASSARMRPLAGTVTVTSAFDTLLTDLSMVAVRRPPLASTTTYSIMLSSASIVILPVALPVMTTFTARAASTRSKSGASMVRVTMLPLPLMSLPKSTDGAAMQTKYVVAVIMVPSRTAIKSILFMVVII